MAAYALAHALSLVIYWFVPRATWPHFLWQTTATTASMIFMLAGVRRLRPEAAFAWSFIAAGMIVNSLGVTVDFAILKLFGLDSRPNPADAFWSAQFPLVVAGMCILARRAAAREDLGAMLRNTLICVPVTFFTGIYAWQFVAWRMHQAENVRLAYKIVVTAYPLGDLMFVAVLLRLAFSVGLKNVSLLLMLGWLAGLFPSDLGWPLYNRTGTEPSRAMQYFMEGTWMAGNAMLGASTWHPDVRELTRPVDGRIPPLGGFGWFCLLTCVLISPLVVILQLILDRVYSLSSF